MLRAGVAKRVNQCLSADAIRREGLLNCCFYLVPGSRAESSDGGRTFSALKGAPGGDDYHYVWIDPTNARHLAFASDQGVGVSLDGGATWSDWFNQPTGQFYHVVTDHRWPYWIYGAQQDAGSVAAVSRSDFGTLTYRDWTLPGAGESGAIAVDPRDSNIVYGGNTYGGLVRFDRTTNQTQDIAPSPRDVEELIDLGQMGYIRAIQLKLEEMAKDQPEHADFVAQMRSLIDRFDLDQYMATLKTLYSYDH